MPLERKDHRRIIHPLVAVIGYLAVAVVLICPIRLPSRETTPEVR